MKTEQPYRPTRLRAEFETWIVPDRHEAEPEHGTPTDKWASKPEPLVREIHGKFTIEIRLSEVGRRSIYRAMVADTLQKFEKTFGLSALPECKSYVESQFKRKLSDWQEV